MIKKTQLKDGSTAVDFTAEDSKQKAIVHLSVIQRLAKLLPKANEQVIVVELAEDLRECAYNENEHKPGERLGTAIDIISDFVAFHKTMNLITLYDVETMNDAEKDAMLGIDRGIKASQQGTTIED